MKISIAMATYNGARYLQAQLDSFLFQTRQPDELVVCDDGSTDDTLKILETFALAAPFSVKINSNKENLGYTKNFEKTISLCSGDLIFLSDQDDVWFNNKLDVVCRIFASNPSIHILVNDQEITDSSLVPSGRTIFMNNRVLGYGEDWITAGCCTAITHQFRDLVLPFPVDLIAHDGWLHRVGVALDVRKVLDDVLQYYRRHDRNNSSPLAAGAFAPNRWQPILDYGLKDASAGWEKDLALSRFISHRLSKMTQLLRDMQIAGVAHNAARYEDCKADALSTRIDFVRRSPIARVGAVTRFFLAGNYRYFSGWKSALKDLLRSTAIR